LKLNRLWRLGLYAEQKKPSLCHDCAIVVSLLVIGIILAIAGVIITILDRSQITRMKQFDDIGTSYSGYR